MIQKRYQYWGPNHTILWTDWFEYSTDKTLRELLKQKPTFKKLKEEYRTYDK